MPSNINPLAELFEEELKGMLVKQASQRGQRDGLHASDLLVAEADWCVRKQYYNALYPERYESPVLNTWDWKREQTFANGWALHRRWQEVFYQAEITVYSDELAHHELDLTHYDNFHNIYYSPDAIIEWAGNKYVVEIKGYNDAEYKRLVDASKPPLAAYRQVNLYLHLLRIDNLYQPLQGIILVENKNSQEFKCWIVEYDQLMAQEYMQRADRVRASVNGAKRPKRVCASPDVPLARRCPFATVCFEEED